MKISLEDHRSGGALVFSGRERGRAVRQSTELRNFDPESEGVIEVVAPKDTIIVTSSFLLGMLGPIIRELGENESHSRIIISGPVNEKTIEETIKEALRGDEPLTEPDQ
ncbi:hypothetical protein GGP51_002184 [Salinibacter ruber]|uniref:hypothetical protein n=1 Tax=Salinibacter ruber TaxID=146919 RepID=UPI002168C352|nr:hypothetical protein [Salinibacter ruber]MCS4190701.1 hypothetical protein [Salinibacter ruber]